MTDKEKELKIKKKYKLVPPDGGWGYMILIAVILNLSSTTMFQGSFGLLYKQFMDEKGMKSIHMSITMGLGAVSSAIAGFSAYPLLSVMSFRKVYLLSALFYNIGMFTSVFINSIPAFYVFVGIFPALGLGLSFNLSFSILNDYFDKRKMVVISVSQTVIALITMSVPMFVKWSLHEYGYRGTLLLACGMTMQSFFGVALIQPVKWHMKKVEILDNEMDELIPKEEVLTEKPKTIEDSKSPDLESLKTNEKVQELEEEAEDINPGGIKIIIAALYDKTLRKTFLLSCSSFGPAVSIFADITYMYMLPQALYAANWDQENVALALSLMGFGDLATRMAFIFISSWLLKLGSDGAFILGIFIAIVARLGVLWSNNITIIMVFITLSGVAHCVIVILLPVVIADAVPPKKFTAAMGTIMLMNGVINMVVGPAIGAVRDLTQSYGAAFYILVSCFAIIALFWIIEIVYKKNEHKRVQRREYLRQKKLNKS